MHPGKGAVDLPLGSLHRSLSDPMLTTMNFLNEITARYPDAISFAPGRPSGEGFSCERIVTWLDGYIAHLAAQGKSGAQGLAAAELARAVASCQAAGDRPRACYLVPDHANPAGNTVPLPGRRELLAVAAEAGILLLEDSPYRLVSTANRAPSLKALDERRCVVHLGSFAKSAFPGLRIGYAVADQQVSGPDGEITLLAEELAKVKSMITLNTPSLSQAVLGGFLVANDFSAARYARPMAGHYDSMLRTVLAGLDEALPPAERERLGVRWNQPEGGFFITVEVPFEADEQALARAAERHGVIWTPMRFFYPSGGGARALRLSCSYLAPGQAREGTRRLAESITAECGELLGSA